MKPAPEASLIRTVSKPTAQYALLVLVGFAIATVAVAYMQGGFGAMLAEVGRMLVGMPKR